MKLKFIAEAEVGSDNVAIQRAKRYLIEYFGPKLLTRWQITPTKVRSSYGETTVRFELVPKFQSKHRTDRWHIYRSVRDAVQEIVPRRDCAYRGMSYEEWETIQRTGVIQSNGTHNFDFQDGFTFYGALDTAEHYATGFATIENKPSRNKPGVVIEIHKKFLLTKHWSKRIPDSEYAHEGGLPASEILRAWLLIPNKVGGGYIDVIDDGRKLSLGSWMHPSISGIAIKEIQLRKTNTEIR